MAFNADATVLGHGKHIAYSDTENGSYTTVDGTVEINLPEYEVGEAEITNDDTSDFHKDYVPSLIEPGEASFTYLFNPDVFAAVQGLALLASVQATRDNATKWWKVTLADGSIFKFRGFVKGNTLPANQEDAITCEATIRVRGKIQTYPATYS